MSIPGERDESLEKWLQQLRPSQHVETASCLDAETAAAWVSGALSGEALQQAQTHLADCDRCQAVVGSLVRADVGGEPKVAAPERVWLRWLVPLAAAATVVIAVGVWATLPRANSEPESPAALTSAAPETLTMPARVDERSAQSFEAPKEPGMAGTVTPSAPAPETEARVREEAAGQLAAAKSPPPSPVAGVASEPARPALSDAAAPANARALQAEGAPHEIVTPDQNARWRIIGRQVQRSMDRGVSWEAVQVGATAAFTAGSAPSRTVCWLVGKGGIVLLTTNGATFTRVPFPEPSDLIAVSAADARSAMVTAADGRTFRTSDGGTTWGR